MQYILGIDIGIASVGWAVVGLDENHQPKEICDVGVRTFVKAENPKNGASLALTRREARSTRRRLRRRKFRLKKIKELFIQVGLTNQDEVLKLDETLKNTIFDSKREGFHSPWKLRALALTEVLPAKDFARVLYHMAKHRGFLSNRKTESGEIKKEDSPEEKSKEKSETQAMLAGIIENKKLLQKYKTVGEMVWKESLIRGSKFDRHLRNKDSAYTHTMDRKDIIKEIEIIFEVQSKLGNQFATADLKDPFAIPNRKTTASFQEAYQAWFAAQRPVDSGGIEKMVGPCAVFRKTEKRAAACAYTSELFMLYEKVNHLTFYSKRGEKQKLNPEQREIVVKMALESSEVKYSQIRKKLAFDVDTQFVGLTIKKDGKIDEGKGFIKLTGFHTMRKHFEKKFGKEAWNDVLEKHQDWLDHIPTALTYFKSDENVREYLHVNVPDMPDEWVEASLELSFSKVKHLSIVAMQKMIPYLKEGLVYSDAAYKAFNHSDPHRVERKKYLDSLDKIDDMPRNPVVARALVQTRKVINAIIRKYGSPWRVQVETQRDLARNFDERKKIEKLQNTNRDEKKDEVDRFQSFYGREPKKDELLKLRLHQQQTERCVYSGEWIDTKRMISDPTYTEVDHILPYSKTYDDSMNNKVLVLTSENRQKGDRIPYEYFASSGQDWEEFVQRVQSFHGLKHEKKRRLLLENLDESEWKERNLNDTKYISRFMSNWLSKYLLFDPDALSSPVLTVNGAVTAYLRARWGLIKDRQQDDRHHALDAVVVALTTRRMVQIISLWSKHNELWHSHHRYEPPIELVDEETGEVIQSAFSKRTEKGKIHFPEPFEGFRDQIKNLVKRPDTDTRVVVSMAPNRKISGEIVAGTLRSPKYLDSYKTAVKTRLKDIAAIKDLDSLIDKEGRNAKLHKALCDRIERVGGKNPFAEPFYLGRNGKETVEDDPQGRLIRSVTMITSGASGISLNKNRAFANNGNGSMVRVDVFKRKKDGKFFLVPVYLSDIGKELPNEAIVTGKDKETGKAKPWLKITDEYEFAFGLYPNDFIQIQLKEDKEPWVGCYVAADRATGAIEIKSPDRSRSERGVGVQNLKVFQKMQVDVLGNITPVHKEKRLGLANRRHQQKSSNLNTSQTSSS